MGLARKVPLCTKELQGVKVTPDVTRDKSFFLRIESVSESRATADTSSDLKLHQAFLRRAPVHDSLPLSASRLQRLRKDLHLPLCPKNMDADRMMLVFSEREM